MYLHTGTSDVVEYDEAAGIVLIVRSTLLAFLTAPLLRSALLTFGPGVFGVLPVDCPLRSLRFLVLGVCIPVGIIVMSL
jgi:hypothetical protein